MAARSWFAGFVTSTAPVTRSMLSTIGTPIRTPSTFRQFVSETGAPLVRMRLTYRAYFPSVGRFVSSSISSAEAEYANRLP